MINILAAPIEKIDPLPYFKIEEPNATLPRIQGAKASDLNLRDHPDFKKDRLQLMAALDLEHRRRADPLGNKSKLIDQNSPDALRVGDTITVETIRSRSYPRSSTITGICKAIVKSGYTSSISIEAVIMGTTVNIQYKVYSPLVKSITGVQRAEIAAEIARKEQEI